MSENVVRERDRAPSGDQSSGSFFIHVTVTAHNTEVRAGKDRQRNFVGSQMYVHLFRHHIYNTVIMDVVHRRRIDSQYDRLSCSDY